MEQWESDADADADDAMDAFLEKFQNETYSGGFHEDQWEEVGGPGPRTCVCRGWGWGWGGRRDTWGSRARRRLPHPRAWRCQRIGGFHLGMIENRP